MKLSLTLFLTITLSVSPFAGFSPCCTSYFTWICNRDKKAGLPEEQHPVETRASSWPCWFGLNTCPVRSGNRSQVEVLPQEQLPSDTQHRTFRWPCWLGLPTCRVTTEDGDQKTAFHKQQLRINAHCCAHNWHRRPGLSEHPRWIRYRVGKVVTPKDPKQQSPSPRQKLFSLHDTLGHLRDSFDRRSVTWTLVDIWKQICILSLLWISRGLWRRVRQLWRQEPGQTASASIRTEHWGKENINASDLLHLMEAEIDIMERHLRTLLQSQREARRCQRERKAEQDGGKGKNPSAYSTFNAD
ncbi:uncharacterized protein LOC107314721 [Coturnix japonica]|uniref:uncharacterized protein LOC107314721 n=1 Tax=Coturnix japonica TaxID=93934 RepID=UPI000777EA07|nr:uncharacterized protein LOC107314721 [Coturnix japonica]